MSVDSDLTLLHNLGMHRVLEPAGSFPQPAWKLDNTPIAMPTETLVDVSALHIDSASFAQIAQACDRDAQRMATHILAIVSQRGKMHNPVTGSGGVLVGTIQVLDEQYGAQHHLAIGDSIVSLTSLSWLPLFIERISTIHLDRCEVEIQGKAIFFRSNPLAVLPKDLSPALVVAALDVAGAPSRVAAMTHPGERIVVLGAGGTAGLLTLCALRQTLGAHGEIIAIDYNDPALRDIATLGVADVIVQGDATQPLELIERVREACRGRDFLADLTINVVNVPQTEFASILLTRLTGRVLFFNMATSFTIAALGAEGLARQVELHIGNGYMPDCGAIALQLLRDFPQLRAIFEQRFPSSHRREERA